MRVNPATVDVSPHRPELLEDPGMAKGGWRVPSSP